MNENKQRLFDVISVMDGGQHITVKVGSEEIYSGLVFDIVLSVRDSTIVNSIWYSNLYSSLIIECEKVVKI